jgi:hypothetical protein
MDAKYKNVDSLTFEVTANNLRDAYALALAEAFATFKVKSPELEENHVSVDIKSSGRF